MLLGITYNCDPESLGDVTPEAFVDAFENEVRAHRTTFRDLRVAVTFEPTHSHVARAESDDWEADIDRDAEIQDTFRTLAERAFRHCLSGE